VPARVHPAAVDAFDVAGGALQAPDVLCLLGGEIGAQEAQQQSDGRRKGRRDLRGLPGQRLLSGLRGGRQQDDSCEVVVRTVARDGGRVQRPFAVPNGEATGDVGTVTQEGERAPRVGRVLVEAGGEERPARAADSAAVVAQGRDPAGGEGDRDVAPDPEARARWLESRSSGPEPERIKAAGCGPGPGGRSSVPASDSPPDGICTSSRTLPPGVSG
jgi:hypothetical protein